jgi:hypothetical protein
LTAIGLPAVLGHPDRPLPLIDQRAKFAACCEFAGLSATQAEALHAACQALPACPDIRTWVSLMAA